MECFPPADPAGQGAEAAAADLRDCGGNRAPARRLHAGLRRGTRLRRRSPACPYSAGHQEGPDRGAGGKGLCRPHLAAGPGRQGGFRPAPTRRAQQGPGRQSPRERLRPADPSCGLLHKQGLLGLRSARSLDPGRKGVRGGVLASGAAPCRHVPPGLCGRRAACARSRRGQPDRRAELSQVRCFSATARATGIAVEP